MTITREKKRRVLLGTAAAAFVALLTAALMPTTPAAATTPQQALAAALAGQYNCTLVDQADGFTLTCLTPTSSPSPTVSNSPSVSPSPSPTVSPSPSPTVSGGNNCQANPGGCGFPDALSTGPAGGLGTWTGSRTFTTAGQTVANTTINGCVEVRAANVTFRNVQFNVGGCFWGIQNFSTGLQVIDSAIDCARTNGNAIGSTNLALVRVEISRCENGLNVAGNVSVTDSWIHDMNGSAGGAHTDGAQFNQGASNIVFQHNTINVGPQNGATSAIIAWNEGNPQNANVTINNNLLAGGTYTLYCPRQNSTNFRVTNNRFGTHEFGSTDSCIPGHVAAFTGNVRDQDGTPVTD